MLIGTFNVADMFLYLSPDLCLDTILSQRSTDNSSDFMAWFVYRRVCAFPNHVKSTEFTTGGLQSSCRNISRMTSGNRMHLSSTL